MDVQVQAERLPGVGWRYTVPADAGRQVLVVAEDRGATHLVLVDPDLDEPLTTVRLAPQHAAVLAALMIRARFTIEAAGPAATPQASGADAGEVVVETVTVGATSPVIGLARRDLPQRLGPDATLLGVICDATPEIVETDGGRPFQVGDRLVVAARRGRLVAMRGAV